MEKAHQNKATRLRVEKATAILLGKLGKRKVLLEGDRKYWAAFDSSKRAFEYSALLLPKTKKDLQAILELANEHRVAVTPRGSGTSLTGSASPFAGGWVLDLSSWNKIEIKREKAMAVVGPGAVIADIHTAAEAVGLFYPPDPASKKFSSIGGNIACNAGGMHGAKYGVTRDFILALEGFLPTGEKVTWGGEYKKFACGYNVRDLWIGSEGTLGIVTKAVLKLVPLPESKWTCVVAFEDEAAALSAVQSLLGQGSLPSILEYLDRHSVYCAETVAGVKLFEEASGKPLLLVELDGSKAQLKADKKKVLEWAKREGLAVKEAKTDKQAEALWEVRRKCSRAMFALGDSKLNEDIVVPLNKQVEFAQYLERLIKSSKLHIATFGHAADGNFHVNIMYHRDNASECKRAEKAVFQLMKKVVSFGGTISGEHGIGLAKTPFMEIARNPAEMKAMKAIKKALDPKNILNPMKLFQEYQVWNHKPEQVKLPWDH